MSSKAKSLLSSILLALFVTLITLILLELALRFVAVYLPMPVISYFHQDLKESLPLVKAKIKKVNPWASGVAEDPDLGWTFIPDFVAEDVNEDGEEFKFTTSSSGFYTPDEPEEDTPQIVVLGDSFLSTFYVKKPIAWVLREQLNLPIYNLAVGGWGPETYQVAYNKYAKRRNAKVVVVFTFNNDITDVHNWQQWQASAEPISFREWLWQNDPSINNTGKRWLDRHSILWNLFKLAAQNVVYSEDGLPGLINNNQQGEDFTFANKDHTFNLQFVKGYQFMYLNPEDFLPGRTYWPYMLAYFESLSQLRDDIEAQGSEMLLVWIPTKERVYLPLLSKDKYKEYVTNSSGEIDGLERALHHYAEEQNIHFFDLTPELVQRASEGQKLYFTVDGHLNSLGNQVVGGLTGDVIRDLLNEMESEP